jgi:hypothetical protein
MPCPSYPTWFNYPNNSRWRIQAVKFIIMQFSPRSVFLLSGPNILLKTMFSHTLSLYSSLKVRDQVTYPYSTTGKITVLYILFRFFIWAGKTKYFWLNDSRHSLNLIYSWLHHECHTVFYIENKILKYSLQYYSFISCFVSVWNLTSHSMKGT